MQGKLSRILIYFFFISLILFLGLATLAILKYPGKELGQESFDLVNDYWCDLFKNKTLSGKENGAKLYAKLATLISAIGFSTFWLAAPIYYIPNRIRRHVTQLFGVAALTLSAFLFTSYHDVIIPLGSLLGGIALVSLLVAIKEKGYASLFRMGILVILLLIACNLANVMPSLYFILPWLQKIALLVTIIWAVSISWQVVRSC